MISDATLKGLQTAAYLKDIASKHGVTGPYETGLVINRAEVESVDLLRDTAVITVYCVDAESQAPKTAAVSGAGEAGA